MKLRPRSLRFQLMSWIVLLSIVVWTVVAFWVYQTTLVSASSVYDYILSSFLESISHRVVVKEGQVFVDFPTEVIPLTREKHVDQRIFKITDQNGRLIDGSEDFPPVGVFSDSVALQDAIYKQRPMRIATRRVGIAGTPLYCDLAIAETVYGRHMVAREALGKVVAATAVLLLIIILKAFFSVSMGLAPLERLRRGVAAVSLKNPKLGKIGEEGVPEELISLVATLNDVLERLSNDIEQQKRFVSNAAHQLRTPMAGLKIQIELLERATVDEKQKAELEKIGASVDRAILLINKMLALSLAEPGKEAWQEEECDLVESARDVVEAQLNHALHKNIDLGFECRLKKEMVRGPASVIRELIANLVENAINYTPEKGTVTAALEREGAGQVVLSVEDNGPGIPAEEREKIFERFYRVAGTPGLGSGLGLAIVKEIADRFNARVNVGSGKSGTGARFEVSFAVRE